MQIKLAWTEQVGVSTKKAFYQCPRVDSGNTGAKKGLDALEDDTHANIQENITNKVQFQGQPPPTPPPHFVGGVGGGRGEGGCLYVHNCYS